MDVRYYVDAETGQPHIYDHGVTEDEVEWILRGRVRTGLAQAGRDNQSGRQAAGRFLRVIYVPDQDGDRVFVVTAYPLTGKPLKAFRRRQRRRKR